MMKQKVLFSVLALVALLVVNTGIALADGTVTGMSVSRDGGLAFTFTVTGYLSPSQLKGGYVQEQGGKSFNLNCAQKDEFTVVCHTSGAISNGVTVGFGGSTYWVESGDMPQPKTGGGSLKYCYPILGSNSSTSPTDYTVIGTRCDPTDEVESFFYDDPYFHYQYPFIYDYNASSWLSMCPGYTDHGNGYYGPC